MYIFVALTLHYPKHFPLLYSSMTPSEEIKTVYSKPISTTF
jgi:hypothetical protein